MMEWFWIRIGIFLINGNCLRSKKYLQTIIHCKSLRKYTITFRMTHRNLKALYKGQK